MLRWFRCALHTLVCITFCNNPPSCLQRNHLRFFCEEGITLIPRRPCTTCIAANHLAFAAARREDTYGHSSGRSGDACGGACVSNSDHFTAIFEQFSSMSRLPMAVSSSSLFFIRVTIHQSDFMASWEGHGQLVKEEQDLYPDPRLLVAHRRATTSNSTIYRRTVAFPQRT